MVLMSINTIVYHDDGTEEEVVSIFNPHTAIGLQMVENTNRESEESAKFLIFAHCNNLSYPVIGGQTREELSEILYHLLSQMETHGWFEGCDFQGNMCLINVNEIELMTLNLNKKFNTWALVGNCVFGEIVMFAGSRRACEIKMDSIVKGISKTPESAKEDIEVPEGEDLDMSEVLKNFSKNKEGE